MTCTTLTTPQDWSSLRLLLTWERATPSADTISSADSGLGEKYSKAWICATMRLMPQRAPISPQCKTSFSMTGSRFISVFTEISRNSSEVNELSFGAAFYGFFPGYCRFDSFPFPFGRSGFRRSVQFRDGVIVKGHTQSCAQIRHAFERVGAQGEL